MKLRNFKLIPIFTLGNYHINIDCYALYQLLTSVKLWPKIFPKL